VSKTSTPEPQQPVDDQAAFDQADEAAGYRAVVDQEEVGELPADDPNVAASQGDHDHENRIGSELDEDPAAGAGDETSDTGEAH
jgi:hypothetical protein